MTRSVLRFDLSTETGGIHRTEVIVPQKARRKAKIPRFLSTGDRFQRGYGIAVLRPVWAGGWRLLNSSAPGVLYREGGSDHARRSLASR
jgi:hypothetical protein